jgi:DNA gyrase subunit A
VNFVGIDAKTGAEREKIAAIVPVSEFVEDGLDLVTCTAKGLVKRTALKAYANIRTTGIIGVAIEEGDASCARAVVDRRVSGGDHRHREGDEHPLPRPRRSAEVGRDSRGVKGIDLRDGDAVVSMDVIRDPTRSRC